MDELAGARRGAEANAAAARAVFEVWNSGELSRLDELVAPGVIHHDPYDPHARDGREGHKRTIAMNRQALPGLVVAVDDQVAERDLVATRWHAEVRHDRPLMGVEPSGREISFSGITIDRFADGRIVEAWRSMDTLGLLTALGLVVARPRGVR
jgi:predicted ester cyclase